MKKHAFGWGASVLLHVAAIAALLNGMAQQPVPRPPPPMMVGIIEEPKPTEPLPQPKPAIPTAAPQTAPKPQPHPPPRPIASLSAQKSTAAEAAPSPPSAALPGAAVAPVAGPPTAPSAPIEIPPQIKDSCRRPDYPPAAKRLGQTGTVVVKFLIDVDGSVADSVVETSSGYPRLDEAAREALALCGFKPGTIDGRPERSWAQVKYVWSLN